MAVYTVFVRFFLSFKIVVVPTLLWFNKEKEVGNKKGSQKESLLQIESYKFYFF
ncbi:hypothetical protein LEP1GSC062_1662 [Leptospira alexanderi serovar Manhao 3 str. L 60]|uniref:Uncharacterized protein n=1 Tax=Leptospira alexanderi serovar Manhao 3 str. L 60 TaxID=1049759 RepID=V6IAP2_9LEPT|nr:hypothetical protein LEP1GSC062_1662 [Leptospira alexanderi serovar Manhao 3 str. L 60]